jgi:hypothetical protein
MAAAEIVLGCAVALTETQLQRAVIAHLRARAAADTFFFHCPNGGYRRRTEAAIFKGLGTVPGIPDLLVIRSGRVFALELKTTKGKLSDAQVRVADAMRRAGADADVVFGLDAAIAWLEARGILRGKSG